MEKKEIDKKFYILSAINIIPALILGGGLTLDSLVLFGSLLVLILNHTVLVNIVRSITESTGDGSRNQTGRILTLLFLKFFLLFGLIALIYTFKKQLMTKLFLIIFFQLIIQVVSIKNNYQK